MKDLKELIEEGIVGFEEYPERKLGGQQCGIPTIGFRFWYPKDEEPDIDIRIRYHRAQMKNKDLAQQLFELALDDIRNF